MGSNRGAAYCFGELSLQILDDGYDFQSPMFVGLLHALTNRSEVVGFLSIHAHVPQSQSNFNVVGSEKRSTSPTLP